MANILDFLTRNPEQAYQMLQAFGAMQQESGSQGFRGILGRELQGIGAIGAAPYELKRQKAEEEYQKKIDELKKREAELSIVGKEKSLELMEREDKMHKGAAIYQDFYNAAKKATKDQKFDPGTLQLPENLPEMRDEWVTKGFISARSIDHADWFSEDMKLKNYELQKIEQERMQLNARNEHNKIAASMQSQGRDDVWKLLTERNNLYKQAESTINNSATLKDLPGIKSGYDIVMNAFKTPDDYNMVVGLIKMNDPNVSVRGQETLDQLRAMLTSKTAALNDLDQWTLAEDPARLDDKARKRIMEEATRLYETKRADADQKLAEIDNDYVARGVTPFGSMFSPGELVQNFTSYTLKPAPQEYTSMLQNSPLEIAKKGEAVQFKDEAPADSSSGVGLFEGALGIGAGAYAAKKLASPMYNAGTSIPGIDADFFRGQSSALHRDMTDVPFKGMMNPELAKLTPPASAGQGLLPPGPAAPGQLAAPPIQMPSGLKQLQQNAPAPQNQFNYGQVDMPGNPMKQIPGVAKSFGSDFPNVPFQDPDMPVKQNTQQLIRRALSAEELTPSQFVRASKNPSWAKQLGIGTTAALMIPSLVDYGLERNLIPGLDTLQQRSLRRMLGVPRVID